MRVYKLKILIFLSLFFGHDAFSENTFFYGIDEGKIGVGVFNYERSYIAESVSDDTVLAARYCDPGSEYTCLISFAGFMVFAIPREGLVVDKEWVFAGHSFRVIDVKNAGADPLFLIEATANVSIEELNDDQSRPSTRTFLYSATSGLVQFNQIFMNGENEVVAEFKYRFLGEGLSLDKLEEIGPDRGEIGMDLVDQLKNLELTPSRMENLVFPR